jgi:hypothetical protein
MHPQDIESVLSIRASVIRFDWSKIAEKVAGEMQAVRDKWLAPVA